MSKIAIDTPNYIIRMLGAVDYSSITDTQYNDWLNTIKENISNHLKKRASPSLLKAVRYPLRQDFCDIINGYDFNSLPFTKKAKDIETLKTDVQTHNRTLMQHGEILAKHDEKFNYLEKEL